MSEGTWRIERADLERAVEAVRGRARKTPLVPAPALGVGVWLKLETAQETGSFKLRGALAALTTLDAETRARGVVSASAGNHGYGIARAGELLGVRVVVFCAASTPRVKREGMAAHGATVETLDLPGYDAVEAHARREAAERGMRFVSPFDDPMVAAGNGGTIGIEILEELPSARTIVAPVGGGGLVAGLAAARRIRGASFALVGVQSEACPAMIESLARGEALLAFDGRPTLAEGLEGGVSETTFAIVRDEVARMDAVSERAIADAMRFAHVSLDLDLEGSAAVAIAWVLAHAAEIGSEVETPLVAIASGGNVDAERLRTIVGGDPL
jgi:threonine dehydratase